MLLYRLPSSAWEEVVVDDIWTTKHAKFIALLMHPTSVGINLVCDYLMRKREKWILTHLVYCIQWRNSLHNRNSLPAKTRGNPQLKWTSRRYARTIRTQQTDKSRSLTSLKSFVLSERFPRKFWCLRRYLLSTNILVLMTYNLICVARSFLPLKPCLRCHICGGGCEDPWRNNKLSSPFFASDFLVHWTNGVTFVTFSSFSPNSVFVPKLPFKARHP